MTNDWIKWDGGQCPIPELGCGEYNIKWDGEEFDNDGVRWDKRWDDLKAGELAGWRGGDITHYRVVHA